MYAKLLGEPGFRRDDAWFAPAAGKVSALLYFLACRGGWVSRDELLGLLWPDTLEAKARSTLRQTLTTLRRLPFTDGLEIERTRLRWPTASDLDAFRTALEGGGFDEAVRLYDGALLDLAATARERMGELAAKGAVPADPPA